MSQVRPIHAIYSDIRYSPRASITFDSGVESDETDPRERRVRMLESQRFEELGVEGFSDPERDMDDELENRSPDPVFPFLICRTRSN